MLDSVSVVVLNWNGKRDTLACLESLQCQTTAVDIVVVDNGSTDGSVAEITSIYPQLPVIETGENLGYSGGNNVGIRHALAHGADYIFVLNNDTRLHPACVGQLLDEHKQHPDAAAISPKSLFVAHPDIIYFAGGRISSKGAEDHIGLHQPDGPAFSEAGPTDWITGCALFASRAAFERVGLFDERFFLLYEDVDWSLRARRAGYSLRYAPAARLWHHGSESFGGKLGPNYQYYFTRNGLLCLERNYPLARLPLLQLHFVRKAWRRMRRLGQTTPTHRALRRATLLGVWDYCRRRFGACASERTNPLPPQNS